MNEPRGFTHPDDSPDAWSRCNDCGHSYDRHGPDGCDYCDCALFSEGDEPNYDADSAGEES